MEHRARRQANGSRAGWALVALTAIGIVALMLVPSNAAANLTHPTHSTLATTCAGQTGPYFSAYDPVNHHVYVPNGNGTITVLKSTCGVVATIHLATGASPFAAAFNPRNNYVYVTDGGLDEVHVLSGTTVIANLTGSFSAPGGLAFDPGDGIMLVPNFFGDNLTVITGLTVISTHIGVGSNPVQVAYDPFYSVVLVTNAASANVTIINATFPFSAGHGSVRVGTSPYAIAYDPHDQRDYVANVHSNNVSEINGAGSLLATVAVGKYPDGIAFSAATLHMYVANRNSNSVWVLDGTTVVSKVHLTSPAGPAGVAYDDFNNDVYVSGYLTDKIYVLT
ncbi:MAG: YncE family protein [Thermoplasmata archaeon]|nr:YncE family protein [Thermoplasmata archaeon]